MVSNPLQYDGIAESYQRARTRSSVVDVFEHTLFYGLGEVSGKSAVDLACGAGSITRRLKSSGTRRTVGIDVSAEMIRLAREQEELSPLGIEYQVRAVQELSFVEEFDLATAIFLLNYAESSQDLLVMCQAIYRSLKANRRFLAISDNISKCTANGEIFRKYGFAFPGNRPTSDADSLVCELQMSADAWMRINARYFHRETYEWALKTAGFREIRWRELVIPQDLFIEEGPEYWSSFAAERPFMLIECTK